MKRFLLVFVTVFLLVLSWWFFTPPQSDDDAIIKANIQAQREEIPTDKAKADPSHFHALVQWLSQQKPAAEEKPAQEDATVVSDLSSLFQAYQDGMKNAFFDDAAFVKKWLTENDNAIDDVRQYLLGTDELATMQVDSSIMEEQPAVVKNRMAAIDLLDMAIEQDFDKTKSQRAKEALSDLVATKISKSLPLASKRVLLADKYEAMQILADYDLPAARASLARVSNPKLRKKLEEALLTGLVESGLTHDEAVAKLAQG